MTSTISTQLFSNAALPLLLENQTKLAQAQKEATTGRHSDVGLSLGYKTGQDLNLRAQTTVLSAIKDSNAVVSTNLDATQNVLTDIAKDANTFLSSLVSSQGGGGNPATLKAQAQGFLSKLTSALNTNVGGNYLFGGINSGVKPVQDYFQTPSGTGQQAVAAAFSAQFPGVTQNTSQESTISPSSLSSFLSGAFSNVFSPSGFKTNFSSASDTVSQSRISQTELVDTGATANNPAFAQLASVYASIADLGIDHLNSSSVQALVSSATTTLNGALQGVSNLQSTLGVTQSRVSSANDRISIQTSLLSQNVSDLEKVDPAEASTRVTTLQTQLEVGYSLTAQLKRLSLVNYLST